MKNLKCKNFLTVFFMIAMFFANSLHAVFPDWSLLTPANSPSARNGHSMVFDPNTSSVILFGGRFTTTPTSTTYGDTWSFNGTNWVQLNPDNSPPARTEAVMAFDPRSQITILFGGLSATNTPLNDTWIFDGTDWTQLFPANSPEPLLDASLAYDPATSQMIFYGGRGIDVPGQTWNWTGSNWQLLTPATSPTPPRNSTALAFFPNTDTTNSQLILFGGATTVSGSNPVNETWNWNGVTWTQLFPANSPSARDLTTLAYYPLINQLILFGGDDDSSTPLGDTWSWDGAIWIARPTTSAPQPRFLSATVFNPITNQFILFGGFGSGINYNDTWVLDNPTSPAITSVTPNVGVAGNVVTIRGANFNVANPNDLTVNFGAVPAVFKNIISPTEIQVIVPPGTGTVHVQVTTPNGISPITPADQFTYFVQGPPSITSISPTSGPASGGTLVTINGTNFTGATIVQFGFVDAVLFNVVSDTQITAISPAGTGVVDVTVITPAGASPDTPADQFTYIAIGLPVVNSVSPSFGSDAGGDLVTITGTNFTGATNVQFGSVNATLFQVISDTQINAISPAGTGVVDITVTNSTGTSLVTPNDQFTYISAGLPVVSDVVPNFGSSAGGELVTITGANFTGATNVQFGSTNAIIFNVISDTQITAITPPGVGVVDVIVTTGIGSSLVNANDQFTYVTNNSPLITLLLPNVGSSLGGTEVVINGSNFFNVTAVQFGGVDAQSFVVISDSQIVAISPPGAGLVNVNVITAQGTSPSTPNSQFSYTPTPPPPVSDIFPPTKARGYRVKNEFATQIVTLNVISWQPPKIGQRPLYYQIYRNQELTELVAVIVADNQRSYRFEEPQRRFNSNYFLVSVDTLGQRSVAIKVKIK